MSIDFSLLMFCFENLNDLQNYSKSKFYALSSYNSFLIEVANKNGLKFHRSYCPLKTQLCEILLCECSVINSIKTIIKIPFYTFSIPIFGIFIFYVYFYCAHIYATIIQVKGLDIKKKKIKNPRLDPSFST